MVCALHADIVYNRGSGRGKAERIAARFERALVAAGITAHLRPVRGASPNGHTPDLLVLVGGDGTVLHAIDDAIAFGAPVYHVPLGNENLFAREFGMTREPGDLLRAIGRWSIDRIDVGVVRGAGGGSRRFSIMLSVGPDASVIHRMERHGRSAAGHLAYLEPVGEEVSDPCLAAVTARVDGRLVVDRESGVVIVANQRHYAMGVDPARHADPRDGLLDLVFMPAGGINEVIRAAAWARIRRLGHLPGVRVVRGREVEVDAPGGLAQVDGEALHLAMAYRIGVEAGALAVLTARVGVEERSEVRTDGECSVG